LLRDPPNEPVVDGSCPVANAREDIGLLAPVVEEKVEEVEVEEVKETKKSKKNEKSKKKP